MEKVQHQKILFRYYSNILDQWINEGMWAIVLNEEKGIYKLDNIPFYDAPIAPNDIFYAEYDETEERLMFREILTYSGYSCVFIVVNENMDKQVFRAAFKSIGCTSEGMNKAMFSMEIPKDVDYHLVKQKLDSFEDKGMLDYAESCLSEKHVNDIS